MHVYTSTTHRYNCTISNMLLHHCTNAVKLHHCVRWSSSLIAICCPNPLLISCYLFDIHRFVSTNEAAESYKQVTMMLTITMMGDKSDGVVWADNGDSLTTPPRPTTHPVSSERFHPLFNWTICEANLSDDHFCCFLLSAIPGSLNGGFQSENGDFRCVPPFSYWTICDHFCCFLLSGSSLLQGHSKGWGFRSELVSL